MLNEDELSNSDELGDEQPDETQDESQDLEQPTDQDSELFSDVDLDTEDDLTIDDLREMRTSMQRSFTQKTQELSTLRRDSELWQTVINHPEIGPELNSMIAKVRLGQPVTAPEAEPDIPNPADINPQEDLAGFMEAVVGKAIADKVAPIMQEINGMKKQMTGVSGYVQTNQRNLEFENLGTKFPAAKVIGVAAIEQIQNQYPGMSMEKALGVLAIDQPELLHKVNTRTKVDGGSKPKPKVLKPGSSSKDVDDIPATIRSRVRDLQKRAKEGASQGLGIKEIISGSFAKPHP